MNSNTVSKSKPDFDETFTLTINNWSSLLEECYPSDICWINSDIFQFSKFSWILRVYPYGTHFESGDNISVTLVNMSNIDVQAKYTITLLNQIDRTNVNSSIFWSDPEGVVNFRKIHSYETPTREQQNDILSVFGDDNEWGCDSFIRLIDLNDSLSGFLRNDKLTFKIDIQVFGTGITSETHEWSKDLSNANSREALISLANQDLSTAMQQLSKTMEMKTMNAQQQDNIIDARLKYIERKEARKMTKYEELHYNPPGHVFTSRLGTAAASLAKTFETSPLIMSLSGSYHPRRRHSSLHTTGSHSDVNLGK